MLTKNIFIDADGSASINKIYELKEIYNFNLTLVSDYNHEFDYEDTIIIKVDQGSNNADFVLLNLLNKDDILITNDYGLATLALTKNVKISNDKGLKINNDNIDMLNHNKYIRSKSLTNPKIKKRNNNDEQNLILTIISYLEE